MDPRTEAFHHLFTTTLPTLIIHLILNGANPQFLRRQIVHGGPHLDRLFQRDMLEVLYDELGLRLSGARPSAEASSSKLPPPPLNPSIPMNPAIPPVVPVNNIGICFHNLSYIHDPEMDEDDHGLCLCQLTTCLACFHQYAASRKGAYSQLPHELANTRVAKGWAGAVESQEQNHMRRASLQARPPQVSPIPAGRGFVKNPKPGVTTATRSAPLFPHPQMTDVLAVEEHLRWRLKEMGAVDPAVESRYGPCTNNPAALDGIQFSEEDGLSEDGDSESVKSNPTTNGAAVPPTINNVNVNANGTKTTNGKSAKLARRKMRVGLAAKRNNSNKSKDKEKEKGKICYLPEFWMNADPPSRNMAIILTFRHFVKVRSWYLKHQIGQVADW